MGSRLAAHDRGALRLHVPVFVVVSARVCCFGAPHKRAAASLCPDVRANEAVDGGRAPDGKWPIFDQRLPCGLLDVVVTPNPKLNAITQPETEAVTDALCEYIAAAHGSWKIGKPLAKHYGKQVEKVLPLLPDYGKVTGAHRKWESMIYEKCRNRFYVPAPF